MKEAIVIGTSTDRENWIYDIVKSFTVPYIIVSTGGYELGKIKWVYENTKIDRFIFLQDSLVIKNNNLFEKVFELEGSSCLMCDPGHMGSYLGLYERKTLEKIGIPDAHSKLDSIRFELEWNKEYIANCDLLNHPIDLDHKIMYTVMKNGRENMVYVNDLYEKWKGDWGQIQH